MMKRNNIIILLLLSILALGYVACDEGDDYVLHFEAHHGPVVGLALFPEEDRIITGGIFDKKVSVWKMSDHTLIKSLEVHTDQIRGVLALKSGDKRYILSYGFDKIIYIWDLFTLELVHQLTGANGRIFKVLQIEDTDFIVSQEEDSLKVWNFVEGGRPSQEINNPHAQGIRYTCAMSSDPMLIATSGNDNLIKIWNAETGQIVSTMKNPGASIYSLIYVKHLNILVTGDNEGAIYKWYWKVGRPVKIYQDYSDSFALELLVIPDSNILITAGFGSKSLFFLDLSKVNEKPLYEKRGHTNEVWRLSYLKDTGFIYSSAADYSVKKWTICQTKYDYYNPETHTCIENCIDKDDIRGLCLSTKSGERPKEEDGEFVLPFLDPITGEL